MSKTFNSFKADVIWWFPAPISPCRPQLLGAFPLYQPHPGASAWDVPPSPNIPMIGTLASLGFLFTCHLPDEAHPDFPIYLFLKNFIYLLTAVHAACLLLHRLYSSFGEQGLL